jgi:hypothetical protein
VKKQSRANGHQHRNSDGKYEKRISASAGIVIEETAAWRSEKAAIENGINRKSASGEKRAPPSPRARLRA